MHQSHLQKNEKECGHAGFVSLRAHAPVWAHVPCSRGKRTWRQRPAGLEVQAGRRAGGQMVSLMVAEIKEGIRGLQGVRSDGNYSNRLEVDLQTRRRGSPSGRAAPHTHRSPQPQPRHCTNTPTSTSTTTLSRATPHWPRRSPAECVCVNFMCSAEFEMDSLPPVLPFFSVFGCAADGFAKKQFQTSLGVVLLSYSAARRSLKAVNYFCLACFRPLILKRFPPAPPK